MASSLLTQIRRLLSDQESALKEVREEKREVATKILPQLDAKEIEIIGSISKIKEIITELEAEG